MGHRKYFSPLSKIIVLLLATKFAVNEFGAKALNVNVDSNSSTETLLSGDESIAIDDDQPPLSAADFFRDFFQACREGDADHVSKAIIEDPKILEGYSSEGETCIMLTSDLDTVKQLVIAGANVNARAKGPWNYRITVLGWHVLYGHTEIVSHLIASGVNLDDEFYAPPANPNEQPSGLLTALDLSTNLQNDQIQNGNVELLEVFNEMTEILKRNGAKPFVGSTEL